MARRSISPILAIAAMLMIDPKIAEAMSNIDKAPTLDNLDDLLFEGMKVDERSQAMCQLRLARSIRFFAVRSKRS